MANVSIVDMAWQIVDVDSDHPNHRLLLPSHTVYEGTLK